METSIMRPPEWFVSPASGTTGRTNREMPAFRPGDARLTAHELDVERRVGPGVLGTQARVAARSRQIPAGAPAQVAERTTRLSNGQQDCLFLLRRLCELCPEDS